MPRSQFRLPSRSFAVVLYFATLAPCALAQDPIIDLATVRPQFEAFFESRRITDGPYGQYRMTAAGTVPSYYGSLDVALSRAIMGEDLFSSLSAQQRSEWIAHLHTFAHPDGTYDNDIGHHQLHRNGMTIGGLGVLGGKQLYPATPLYAPFDQPQEVATYLAGNINWASQWSESHKFWGGLHMYSQSSVATPEWNDAVFDWLDDHIHPTLGWFANGSQVPTNIQGLGGGAHIWPIYEHLGHDFPEPELVIDRILEMQVASGRFGGNNSGYMDLDALYGLKYMRSLAPQYRVAEIDQAVETFGTWLTGSLPGFLGSNPNLHETLSKVGAFGLLNQLAPELFPDSTGARWTDIFTDQSLYQTAAVETFLIDLDPVGDDSPSVYSGMVTAANPVGYWRLGQTGGIVAPSEVGGAETAGYFVRLDSSVGPGSLGQPGPQPSQGFYGMGDENRAPHFDGDTSYVAIPDSTRFDQTGAITMEAWIKLDEYPEANGGIVAKYLGAGNQRGYEMYVNIQNGGRGELGMVISSDGTFTTAANLIDDQPLPLGEWLHVVSVFEPDQFMRLYIDGELVSEMIEGGSVDVPSAIFSNSADLWIGRQFSSSSTFHFPGLIDEVALYDRALSADEIQLHYLAATQLPGDFNRDGRVDAADFLVWRNSLGSEVNPLTVADADGDGIVTTLDYNIWKEHFGLTLGGTSLVAAQVPEPAALCLIAALLPLTMVARRQRQLASSPRSRAACSRA